MFFSIAPKTFEATPTVPRIPEPISAIIDTFVVTSNFLIIFPNSSISNVLTALSRSVFFTTIVILDSEGFWEIIITLIPAFASVANIFAAVPGVPTILPPRISISPLF